MTYRTTWTPHGSPFPAWADHPTAEAAHRHAMNTARDLQVEVAVVPIEQEDA